jgi:excisionase family DNA binding protein
MAPTDDLLTVEQVAEELSLNQQTVRNFIDRGQLKALRVGGRRVRIQRSELDRFTGLERPARSRRRHEPASKPPVDLNIAADALDQIAEGISNLATALRLSQERDSR